MTQSANPSEGDFLPQLLWKISLDPEKGAQRVRRSCTCPPCLLPKDGKLWVLAGGTARIQDFFTDRPGNPPAFLAAYETGKGRQETYLGLANPPQVISKTGKGDLPVVVLDKVGIVHGVAPDLKKTVWAVRLPWKHAEPLDLVVAGEMVLACSDAGVHGVRMDGGRPIWSWPSPASPAIPIASSLHAWDGHVLVVARSENKRPDWPSWAKDPQRHLVCLDLHSGREIWRQELKPDRTKASSSNPKELILSDSPGWDDRLACRGDNVWVVEDPFHLNSKGSRLGLRAFSLYDGKLQAVNLATFAVGKLGLDQDRTQVNGRGLAEGYLAVSENQGEEIHLYDLRKNRAAQAGDDSYRP